MRSRHKHDLNSLNVHVICIVITQIHRHIDIYRTVNLECFNRDTFNKKLQSTVVTWVSVSMRLVATSKRLGLERYLFSLKCFSSSRSCWEVKAVRGRRVLPSRLCWPIPAKQEPYLCIWPLYCHTNTFILTLLMAEVQEMRAYSYLYVVRR